MGTMRPSSLICKADVRGEIAYPTPRTTQVQKRCRIARALFRRWPRHANPRSELRLFRPVGSAARTAKLARSAAVGRPGADISLQPREHLAMPQPRVLRLHNPVVFVREIHEPGRHAFESQRVEVLQAVVEWHAKVLLTVDDQGRRLEVGGEALRRLL